MKNSTILSVVGVAAIMLVVGTILGATSFSPIKTERTTTTFYGSSTITSVPTSQAPVTLTEYLSRSVHGDITQYIIGTCTGGGPALISMTSTSYIEPANITGYFNATIVTTTFNTDVEIVHTTTITTTTISGACPLGG